MPRNWLHHCVRLRPRCEQRSGSRHTLAIEAGLARTINIGIGMIEAKADVIEVDVGEAERVILVTCWTINVESPITTGTSVFRTSANPMMTGISHCFDSLGTMKMAGLRSDVWPGAVMM